MCLAWADELKKRSWRSQEGRSAVTNTLCTKNEALGALGVRFARMHRADVIVYDTSTRVHVSTSRKSGQDTFHPWVPRVARPPGSVALAR